MRASGKIELSSFLLLLLLPDLRLSPSPLSLASRSQINQSRGKENPKETKTLEISPTFLPSNCSLPPSLSFPLSLSRLSAHLSICSTLLARVNRNLAHSRRSAERLASYMSTQMLR